MTPPPRQMPLVLQHRPALGRADFLVSEANANAVRVLTDWPSWPGRRLALTGPARAGKTHLAHVWMHETGAPAIAAADLTEADAERLVGGGHAVIEDVDALARLPDARRDAAERALFHLWNLAGAEGAWLLFTARERPGHWQIRMPDLASRVATLTVARLSPPDDMLLSSLMVKLFADRQLKVAPGVIKYLAPRIERSCAAAEDVVAALDRLSLAHKRPVTRAMAVELLDRRAADSDAVAPDRAGADGEEG